MSAISGYPALAAAQPDDVLPVTDVHDTTQAPAGTTKKITIATLLSGALPALAAAAASASATLAANTVTQVTAASNLTMTLPSPAAGQLIVVERETGSTGTVTISGSIRGAAGTITLQLDGESEMFLGTASTWDPVAGHKTLSSLDARYLLAAGGTLAGPLAVDGSLVTPPVTLTDASSIAVNAALSNVFRDTLAGNRTLANPTNPSDGQVIVFEVIQDGTGSRTLAYGTAYSFPASIGTPVLSATAGYHDFLVFRYNLAAATWYCVGFTPQQSAAVPVTVAQGGTGLSSLTAYELLAGGTTSTGALQQIGLGTSGQVLTSNGAGALPSMQAATGGGSGMTNPMTTLGDLIYENATPAAARLAGSTSATKQFLTQTGTGSVSAVPGWAGIAAADLPAGTTSAQGALQLDGTAADIQPAAATTAAGSTGKAADAGHTHANPDIVPADHGLLAWSTLPDLCYNGFLLVAGTVYLMKIPVRSAITATYLWYNLTVAGAGASTGSYIGLYSSSGTLLTSSADQASAFTVSGNHQGTLATPQSLSAGFVWAAILTNLATTQPTIRGWFTFGGSPLPNWGIASAANYRTATAGTGQTSLPGSFTPSSLTYTSAYPYLAGLS